MSKQMVIKRFFALSLMALVIFLWSFIKPANAADKGNFGTDGFGSYSYQPPNNYNLSEIKEYFAWEADQMTKAGITWNRTLSPAGGQFSWYKIEVTQGTYNWEIADALVKACQENGIHLLALVNPYASWDQPGKDDKQYGKPNDMNAFAKFLKAMVERYDGDGVDDMPELDPNYAVKHWEIDNEPEFGKYGGTSAGVQQYQDYYDTLKTAYEAIKSADPDAKVLNAGTSPIYNPSTGNFETVVWNFWDSVLNKLGGKNYIDILDIHSTIPEPSPPLKDFIDNWKNFSKTIWVTETGTYSGSLKTKNTTYPYQSPEYQAGWWIKHCCYGFAHGVTKLFWAAFYYGSYTPDWFQYTAMIDNNKSTNPIYTTQKVMASKIDNFSSVEEVLQSQSKLNTTGEPEQGQYKFTVNGNSVYVLWGSSAPPSEITGNVKVTDINGNEQILQSSSLKLSDNPIFVEPEVSGTTTTTTTTTVTTTSTSSTTTTGTSTSTTKPSTTTTESSTTTTTATSTTTTIAQISSINALPKSIVLSKKQKSQDVRITVLGKDGNGIPSVDVSATIGNVLKKIISLDPETATTDDSGKATFTVSKAGKKKGTGVIVFKADTKNAKVKVNVK